MQSDYIVIHMIGMHYILINVHRVMNMSKETVYHGRQDDVQSVHSMYEVTERHRKLKPRSKVLVRGLCTLAILLQCTNVVMSSRRENKDHPIDYQMSVQRVLPVRNDTLCEHGGHQFNLGQSNKRLSELVNRH